MRLGQLRKAQVRNHRRRHVLVCGLLLGASAIAHDDATWIRGDDRPAARLVARLSIAQAGTASRPVVYDIRLVNEGIGDQPDDPAGDELVDVLPPELALRTADADGGAISVDLAGNIVRWNGALAAGAAAVTIRIEADVVVTQPTTIRNQASVYCDGDGDGRNDSARLSTDPSQPGDAVPTMFRFPGVAAMPGEAQPAPADERATLAPGAIVATGKPACGA